MLCCGSVQPRARRARRLAKVAVMRARRWVEYLDIALLAQVVEPIVKERIHALLEQDLFNAG